MKKINQYLALLPAVWVACQSPSTAPPPPADDYWLLVQEPRSDRQGYRKSNGELAIPFGKYPICQTDTFRTYAVVLDGTHWVGIDRQERVLYQIHTFDNGPDEPVEGLFRILQNDKMGFADKTTGAVVIQPQFDGAFPFENSKARVCVGCQSVSDGEHSRWEGGEWFFIDHQGKRVE